MNILKGTITNTKKELDENRVSSYELVEAYLARIKETDEVLHSFVSVTAESALEKAKEVDTRRAKGEKLSYLAGIPFSLKDNFCTKGISTTASSNILKDYVSPYNATVYQKLLDNDAILLGKTNMDSFAHGSSTETSDFFTTSNPWNTDHLPGGSSGGSAASVIAEQTVFSIGSETAGSIRHPSAWCGVTGLKPTYGRVSRYGVIAMGSSLDSPGPITKSVKDAAYVLQAIAGTDPFDATTAKVPVADYLSFLGKGVAGLKIGIPDTYFEIVDDAIRKSVMDALEVLEKEGAKLVRVNLLDPQYAIAVYTVLQRSEVSSNLGRYDGIRMDQGRQQFNDENIRRIMLGTYTLSAGYYDAYYLKAQKVRTEIIKNFEKVFNEVDVIISPTTPQVALPKGASKESAMFGELMDVMVEPSTIAGIPGLNVPCGFSNGLPIGMQILGPQFAEGILLQVGDMYQEKTGWHTKRPEIVE